MTNRTTITFDYEDEPSEYTQIRQWVGEVTISSKTKTGSFPIKSGYCEIGERDREFALQYWFDQAFELVLEKLEDWPKDDEGHPKPE